MLQSLEVCKAVPSTVCERHVYEYMQQHAADSQGRERSAHEVRAEAIRAFCKTPFVSDIEGAPGYWATQLHELKGMCQEYGLPDCFLTLTSDEVSSTRFLEIDDIERLVRLVADWPNGSNDPPLWAVSGGAQKYVCVTYLSKEC